MRLHGYCHQIYYEVGDLMRIGFIGAGKVGFSLGRFMKEGGVQVTGYYNRHREGAIEAAEFTGSICYDNLEELVQSSDAIFLTVPDNKITEVYESIRRLDIRNKMICHCSGAMSAREAFPGIEEHGAAGYSIHPLFPVSDKLTSYRELGGAFFCIEGMGPLDIWKETLESLGARVQVISGDVKSKYHAACAISSNLVCGLVDMSLRLLEDCGFTEEGAREALRPLAMSNMSHLLKDGPISALTGPVERGDAETVSKHIEAIEDDNDRNLYIAASKAVLEIARRKNPGRDYEQTMKILAKEK